MWKRALLGALLALLAMSGMARAQTATGQITGTVKDTSGAVVPGATVTVHSALTGLTRTATTNASGDYVPAPADRHVLGARRAQGFNVAKQSGIRLNVDQVARIDLDAGGRSAATETVEVQAGHGRPRHRNRHRGAGDRREADHGPAAQRAELFVAAVPGGGRGRDRRRAGNDAAGRWQRDQHHGRPADLEQLHDRRDGEH